MKISRHRNGSRGTGSGFSLLELLVVLLTFGILLSIAVPTYRKYSLRAYRAEAIRMVLAMADCQERNRASTGFYDTSICGEGLSSDHYSLRMEPEGELLTTTYRIVAEPLFSDSEDPCGFLSLDHAGTRDIGGADEVLNACWSGR